MKKVLKYTSYLILLIILLFGILISYIKFALPDVGKAEVITIEKTEARIARGKYLANCVTVCMDCHSTRDWTKFAGPMIPGTLGKGGEIFDQQFNFPGKFISKNITPAGVGSWTDGELLRAISCGVDKYGVALFPVMPHHRYGLMDKEDVYSIIAYIRTLTPIVNVVAKSSPDFPMNVIINTIPKKANFTKIPSKGDAIAYGGYLFNAAACGDCHTKQVKGKYVEGMDYAGGFEFPLPSGGIVRSANITPDQETGIGAWSEETFMTRFRLYRDSAYTPPTVAQGAFNSVMPWNMYCHMEESDLKAIYAYVGTLKPIRNSVVKFSAP